MMPNVKIMLGSSLQCERLLAERIFCEGAYDEEYSMYAPFAFFAQRLPTLQETYRLNASGIASMEKGIIQQA